MQGPDKTDKAPREQIASIMVAFYSQMPIPHSFHQTRLIHPAPFARFRCDDVMPEAWRWGASDSAAEEGFLMGCGGREGGGGDHLNLPPNHHRHRQA